MEGGGGGGGTNIKQKPIFFAGKKKGVIENEKKKKREGAGTRLQTLGATMARNNFAWIGRMKEGEGRVSGYV